MSVGKLGGRGGEPAERVWACLWIRPLCAHLPECGTGVRVCRRVWGTQPEPRHGLFLLPFAHPLASPLTLTPAGQLESPCPDIFQQNWPWPLSRAWEGRQPQGTPWGFSAGCRGSGPAWRCIPAFAESSICPATRSPVPAMPSPGVTRTELQGLAVWVAFSPASITASDVLTLNQGNAGPGSAADPASGSCAGQTSSLSPV